MARPGMSSLIELVRGLANVSTADALINGISYFSNEHIEEALDRHRTDHYREQLTAQTVVHPGAVVKYFDYYWECPFVEEAMGGTLVWSVTDSTGATQGTSLYTVNYEAQHIRFNADQAGTLYYLLYRSYDVHRAAASILRRKASQVSASFDISTDNHSIKRGQLIKNYMDAAKMLEAMGGARSVTRVRDDLLHIERTKAPY